MSCKYWAGTIIVIILSIILLYIVKKQNRLSFRNGHIYYNTTDTHHARSPPKHLHSCKLCFDIHGLSVGWRELCVSITVKRAAFWINLPDLSDQVVTVWAEPSWWTLLVKRVVKWVVVVVGRRVVVVVEEDILIRIASSSGNSAVPERLYHLQLQIGPVNFSWRHRQEQPLSINNLSVKLGCHAKTKMESMDIVIIERVSLRKQGHESVLDLGDQIRVNITSPLMMFIGSIVDRQAKRVVKGEKLFKNEPFTLRLPLPDLVARLRPIRHITITIHIPVFEEELHCLEKAQLNLLNVCGQLFIRDMTPYFCLDVQRVSLAAKALDVEERSGVTSSIADRLWGQYVESEVELVVIESLCVSDYGRTDFGVKVEVLSELIEDLGNGKGPWWWRQRPEYSSEYDRMLGTIANSLRFDVDREDLGTSPYLLTILATMDSFRLYLPPEFPVGFLIDQAVYIYKAALKGDSWDVVSTAGVDFVVRLSAKQASVVFGDDEIDVTMGRVCACKRALFDWLLLQKGEQDHEAIFKEYQKICEEYSEEHVDSDLMKVHASDLVVQVQWKHDWSATDNDSNEGIVRILCGISEEQALSVPLLSKMDTLIGGFMDASCNNLSVSFRDYGLAMLSIPRMRIHGLLFLLELLPEPAAIQKIPLTVYHGSESSNLTRAPNGSSFVVKNTNPLKIFHCANLLSHGNELTRVAFSPRWLAAFQQLDRAVEMFASPAADPSPILPVWDKVRFLLRGTYTAVTITTPGQFDLLLGEDLRAVDDRLSIVLPMGTTIEQSPGGRLGWELPAALLTANSRHLGLLKYHLSTEETDNFAKADKKDCKYLGNEQVLLATLPKCRLQGHFKCLNKDGIESIDHFAVQTVVQEFAGKGHDSFSLFRSEHILLTVAIDTGSDKLFQVIHYRELEEWFVESLAKIVDVPCKKGSLWRTAFIPQHRPFDIKRILKDIRLAARLHQQPLKIRLQSFHAVNEYSGVSITASGFSIDAHWRRWHNRYRTLMAQWDILDGRIACFASCLEKDLVKSEYRVDIVKGIVGVEVLRAPVICSHTINQRIFSRDRDGGLLSQRRQELLDLLPTTTGKVDLERACKNHLKHIVDLIDNQIAISTTTAHQYYTAYDPNVSWDEDCRETVYSIFYQQTVREESKFALSNKMEKLLEQVMSFQVVDPSPEQEHEQAPLYVDDDQVWRELESYSAASLQPRIAEPDFTTGKPTRTLDLRSPQDMHSDYLVPSLTEIKLVNAQVALHVPLVSEDDAMPGRAVMLVVPEVLIQTGTIYPLDTNTTDIDDPRFEYGRIGRRTRFVLDRAQVLVVPRTMTDTVFFTNHQPDDMVSRITDQITIQGVYDMTWTAGSSTFKDSLYGPDRGDSIRVHCPSFAVRCKSAEFATVLALINRLLVYRDARLAQRSARKAVVYEEAIAGKTAKLAALIEGQKQDHDRLTVALHQALHHGDPCDHLLQSIDDRLLELSVMSEAITAMRSEQERLQPQSRLSIQVVLEEAAWTLLTDHERLAGVVLTGLREEWTSERDGSVGSVFEVQSIVADGANVKRHILEPLPQDIAAKNKITVTPQTLLRFSFKANQGRRVGAGRTIEHAELVISPLRLYLLQSQAQQLFRFFFPADATDEPTTSTTTQTLQTTRRKKEKIDFTVITVPASNHVLTFKPDTTRSDLATALIDTSDFLLRIPDLEYTNEVCTWDDLAVKLRNDAIVVLLRNAGKLIRQKFTSQHQQQPQVVEEGKDRVKDLYQGEALPVPDDDRGEGERAERVNKAAVEEQERKGRFLFGRYYGSK